MDPRDKRWSFQPSYAQLQQAVETLNAGLLVRSLEGEILFANERALELCGYEPEELDGQDLTLLSPPELRAVFEEEMQLIVAGDQRARITVFQRKDGRTFPVVTAARVLRDEDEITGVLTVFLDLGEVQAAKRVGSTPATGLAATLERIAGELQTISLFTGASAAPVVPFDHPDLRLLSKREREVLSQLLGGARVPIIAGHLSISPHTVRNHLKSIYRKLDVSDQATLIERVRALSSEANRTSERDLPVR